MKIEKIVILVSNKENQISSLFKNVPICLMPYDEIPLIESGIKNLNELGYSNISIVCGNKSQLFSGLKNKYNVEILVNNDYEKIDNDLWFLKKNAYSKNTVFFRESVDLRSKNHVLSFLNYLEENENNPAFFSNESDNIFSNVHAFKEAFLSVFYITEHLLDELHNDLNSLEKSVLSKTNFSSFLYKFKGEFTNIDAAKFQIKNIVTYEDALFSKPKLPRKNNTILFTPGPVNIHPSYKSVLTETSIHHRSQFFGDYIKKTKELLREVFQSEKGILLIINASATAMQEASVVNLLNKGDDVLVIVTGHFSERYREILAEFGCNVDVLQYEYGQTFDIKQVNQKLLSKKYKALVTTHLETSTGVLHNIKLLSESLKKYAPETLFFLDSVSSIIHKDINFDKYNIDLALATSGKGFSTIPGLSFVCLSQRALEIAKKSSNFKFYFDFVRYAKCSEENSTLFTIPTSIFLSVYNFLSVLKLTTVEVFRQNHQTLYDYLEKEFEKLGFKSVVNPENKIQSLLVVKPPVFINALELRNAIEYENGCYMELSKQSSKNEGLNLRIGISYAITMENCELLVKSVAKYLKNFKKQNKKQYKLFQD